MSTTNSFSFSLDNKQKKCNILIIIFQRQTFFLCGSPLLSFAAQVTKNKRLGRWREEQGVSVGPAGGSQSDTRRLWEACLLLFVYRYFSHETQAWTKVTSLWAAVPVESTPTLVFAPLLPVPLWLWRLPVEVQTRPAWWPGIPVTLSPLLSFTEQLLWVPGGAACLGHLYPVPIALGSHPGCC